MKTFNAHMILGLLLCGVVAGCSMTSAAETKEIACEADAVFPKRRCVVDIENGEPNGTCRAYDDQDRLILTEDYVNGRVHGKRICYYPSGKKFSEMTFENGLSEGETKTWYEDGTVASVDHMRRGLPNGNQTLYFRNGNKSVETPHVDAVAHGTCRHYLPDDRLFGLSTFQDGVETGKQVIIEPTAKEYGEILEAGKFSAVLKDHWTSKVRRQNDEIRQGDDVEVEWKGKWFPASVLRIEKRGYLIHYTGYDDSWDEYVWKDRIRLTEE
jgi:antitoxin component YwqK of YwqJK toxin-antitoxin module